MSTSAPGSPFPLFSLRFARAFLVTARPYLAFVSGSSGVVGLVLVSDSSRLRFVLGAFAFFVSYGFAQPLTDVFQTDTDALSSPYRPLVRGEISKWQVLGVSLVALALVAVVFALLNPWTLLLSALVVAGLVAYTPFKRHPFTGPPWNSAVVALAPAIGLWCIVESPRAALRSLPLWLAMASVFFSYAVFVLLGYLKDVEADRATGYETFPVRYGRKATVLLSAVHGLLALACSAALLTMARGTALSYASVGALLWLTGALLLGVAHLRIWSTTRDDQAYRGLTWVVVGYVALHLGETSLLAPWLAIPSVVTLALCALAVYLRPERSQL